MRPKPLTKEDILRAMRNTKSNRAGARYLGCSWMHYKRYAQLYNGESGQSLFDEHKNQSGKGIPKFLNNSKKEPALNDILEGRISITNFTPEKIRNRLLKEGLLKEECYKCGFHERRVSDYKIPLILNFIDKNKKNYNILNLELLCYNCFFLYIDDLFNNKQIQGLEDYVPSFKAEIENEWDMDDFTKQRLQDLGLYKPESDDGKEFISRL